MYGISYYPSRSGATLDTFLEWLKYFNIFVCWWSYELLTNQGWSLSDVMFVTKHNMANAVATVSKQLEHVHEAVAVRNHSQPLFSMEILSYAVFLDSLYSLRKGIWVRDLKGWIGSSKSIRKSLIKLRMMYECCSLYCVVFFFLPLSL